MEFLLVTFVLVYAFKGVGLLPIECCQKGLHFGTFWKRFWRFSKEDVRGHFFTEFKKVELSVKYSRNLT